MSGRSMSAVYSSENTICNPGFMETTEVVKEQLKARKCPDNGSKKADSFYYSNLSHSTFLVYCTLSSHCTLAVYWILLI